MIFNLAEEGFGSAAIAEQLEKQRIFIPSVYKYQKGITHHAYIKKDSEACCRWNPGTVSLILTNPVYTGLLANLYFATRPYKMARPKKTKLKKSREINICFTQDLYDILTADAAAAKNGIHSQVSRAEHQYCNTYCNIGACFH